MSRKCEVELRGQLRSQMEFGNEVGVGGGGNEMGRDEKEGTRWRERDGGNEVGQAGEARWRERGGGKKMCVMSMPGK